MSEVENERGYSNKSRGISRFAFPGTFFPPPQMNHGKAEVVIR